MQGRLYKWIERSILTVEGPTFNLNNVTFVAFCSFFPCSLTVFHRGRQKVGVDNEKALELTNSTVFHRGRQQKSSRA